MSKFLSALIPALFLALRCAVCYGESRPDLQLDVELLSDSFCAGRKTGTGGAMAAAHYICRRLESFGYVPERMEFDLPDSGNTGRNVLVRVPGARRSSRWIIVAAHYDGLGIMDGKLFPGADSNSSGVAGVLSLADGFVPLENAGVVFAFLDGSSEGYEGASRLLKSMGRQKISLFVSLDTIGSSLAPVHSYRPKYLIALGGSPYRRTLDEISGSRYAYEDSIYIYYDYYGSRDFTDLFYRRYGDQKVFLEAGIPSVVFTSGITKNTNLPSDTADTLDYALLSSRLDIISGWLRTL